MLAELKALVADCQRRMIRCTEHALDRGRTRLTAAARGLPRPEDLLALPRQRFDHAAGNLGRALTRHATLHEHALARVAGRLGPQLLDRPRRLKGERLAEVSARMRPAALRGLERLSERLANLDKLRASFNPDGPLRRGFARVHRADGALVRAAAALAPGDEVRLVFVDGDRGAVIEGAPPAPGAPAPPPVRAAGRAPPARPARGAPGQGDLF